MKPGADWKDGKYQGKEMLKLRDCVTDDTIFSIRRPNKEGNSSLWTRGEIAKPAYVRVSREQLVELRDFLVVHLAKTEAKDGA